VTVASGEVGYHSATSEQPRLVVDRLVVSAPGARVELAGQAAVDVRDVVASAGSWRASGSLDAAALVPYLSRDLERAEGRLEVAASLDGTPRKGTWRGTLNASRMVLVPRGAAARVSVSPLHASLEPGHLVRVDPVEVSLGPDGRISVGSPSEPTLIEVRELDPLDLGRVAVAVHGAGLSPPGPISGVRVSDGALDLRLNGPSPDGRYLLTGTVLVPRAAYEGKPEGQSKLSTSGKSASARLLRRLWLDVRLRVPELHVAAPGPDLTLNVDCRLEGPLAKLKTSGTLRGDGPYSRVALFLVDHLGNMHVRDCRK
jgi:hypothetical protein